MPLQAAMIKHDEFPIVARPIASKNFRVNVIDEDGTFFLRYGTRGDFIKPEMVRDDDMIRKAGGKPFNFF